MSSSNMRFITRTELSIFLLFLNTHLLYSMKHTSILNNVDQQIMLCVETIIQRHFPTGQQVFISTPNTELHTTKRPSLYFQPPRDNSLLVNSILKETHEKLTWPIQFHPPDISLYSVPVVSQNYILLAWLEEEDNAIIESLQIQVDMVKESEGTLWNPRGRFLIVLTKRFANSSLSLAYEICNELWEEHNMINVVILIPSFGSEELKNDADSNTSDGSYTLDLYTGFPFEMENCGKLKDVALLDQWLFANNRLLSGNVNLFPQKVPTNFQGCPIKVATIGIEPFVYLTENYTNEDGSKVYKLRGISVEYLLLSIEKINMSVDFLRPVLSFSASEGMAIIENLINKKLDIVVGTIALVAPILSSITETSIPYIFQPFLWYVPCPRSISSMKKIVTTYKLSVWITMLFVFILTSVIFWCSFNCHHNTRKKESNAFKTISLCVYNAWAAFIGVSVPDMPKLWKLRLFFLLYVCYCFALNVIFQAYFISYLVEPAYEKKMENFEELLESNVKYGFVTPLEMGAQTTPYTEHLRFHSSRRINCADLSKCMNRIMIEGDLATISVPVVSEYQASIIGVSDKSKVLCTLDGVLFTSGVVAVFPRGSPYLYSLNRYIRLSVEGGLVERHWKELNSMAHLQRNKLLKDVDNNLYFVFTIFHLSPAFCVLGFGYVLSFITFLIEIIQKIMTV